MGIKLVKATETNEAYIESTWKALWNQAHMIRVLDNRNSKPIDRAGKVGEEIRHLLELIEAHNHWKVKTDD